MAKYKVIEEVEVLGEVRAAGSEIEIDEETASVLVTEGKLELIPDAATPPTPPASGSTTPPPPGAAPSTDGEKPKDWVGNHKV
jgi:hypothetical protein